MGRGNDVRRAGNWKRILDFAQERMDRPMETEGLSDDILMQGEIVNVFKLKRGQSTTGTHALHPDHGRGRQIQL